MFGPLQGTPLAYLRPSWMWLGVTLSSGRCLCPRQGRWDGMRWAFKSLPTQTSLRFWDFMQQQVKQPVQTSCSICAHKLLQVTSAVLTGERTTALSHKYICRGKSSVSNVRKSQLTAQTGLPHQNRKSATYSHLPPSPVLSNLLAESGSSKRGSKWWICLLLPVFHAFIQEDSHHRAHSRT